MPSRYPEAILTLIGTGTLVPDARRRSPSHHLTDGRLSLLMDAGPGSLHGLAEHGIDWTGLTHVAITHFHNDHVGDLAALLFALRHGLRQPRTAPLTLVGPPGLRHLLLRLAAAFGSHVSDPGFALEVVELDAHGSYWDHASSILIRSAPTPHAEPSLAYLVEGAWGRIGYTGDTGPSEDVAAFLEGCHALIAECTLSDPPANDRHLSPRGLAALAGRSGPGLLAVTHVYPPRTPLDAARALAELWDGPVLPGFDGARVRVGGGRATVDPPGAPV